MQDTSYKLWVMLSRVDTELLLAVGRAISRPNNSEKPTTTQYALSHTKNEGNDKQITESNRIRASKRNLSSRTKNETKRDARSQSGPTPDSRNGLRLGWRALVADIRSSLSFSLPRVLHLIEPLFTTVGRNNTVKLTTAACAVRGGGVLRRTAAILRRGFISRSTRDPGDVTCYIHTHTEIAL